MSAQPAKQFRWAAASVALLVAGTSFYQSILLIPATIYLIASLNRVQEANPSWSSILRRAYWIIALTLSSFAIYSIITIAALHELGIPRAHSLDMMTAWFRFPAGAVAWEAITAVRGELFGHGFYGNGMFATIWLAVGIILIKSFRNSQPPRQIMFTVMLLAMALIAPFILVLILGEDQPARVFLAQPIVFAGVWAIALRSEEKHLSALPAAICAIAVLSGSYTVSALFFSDTMAYEADTLLATRIVSAIYRADPEFDQEKIPVYFSGAVFTSNLWRHENFEVFGASFFSWDGGNPKRIIAFLKTTSIADLTEPSAQQIAVTQSAMAAMPSWPNPNSVRLIGNIMAVRLGHTP